MKLKSIIVAIRQVSIVCLSALISITCAEQNNPSNSIKTISADKLLVRIENEGASAVLYGLYNDFDDWGEILKMIASGNHKWLTVANKLKSSSDAGASIQISNAVGEALSVSPENVLTISDSNFSLDSVCSGPDVDDSRFNSYELSNREIEKRIVALQSIGEKELSLMVDQCIVLLKQSRANIANFYEVKPK